MKQKIFWKQCHWKGSTHTNQIFVLIFCDLLIRSLWERRSIQWIIPKIHWDELGFEHRVLLSSQVLWTLHYKFLSIQITCTYNANVNIFSIHRCFKVFVCLSVQAQNTRHLVYQKAVQHILSVAEFYENSCDLLFYPNQCERRAWSKATDTLSQLDCLSWTF